MELTGHASPWWLALYVAAIMAGLAALRFAWVWVSFRITLLRRAPGGDLGSSPPWRLVAAMSFAGVRGAITLAGVLTLPLAMGDGTPFPGRELAIFLATGVILASLVLASLGLPLLLRGLTMPPEPSQQAEEDKARVAAAEAARRSNASSMRSPTGAAMPTSMPPPARGSWMAIASGSRAEARAST